MRNIYRGSAGWSIKCSNFEELEKAIKSGEWFRTDDMDWWYRSVPFERKGNYDTTNVVLLRRVSVTSKTTYQTYFYRIDKIENPGVKVFTGKAIEDKICEELKLWVKDLNTKTLRAFSGKSFISYLNAIPQEIFLREGFVDRMKKVLVDNFVDRMNLTDSEEEIEEIFTISQATKKIVDENVKRGHMSRLKGVSGTTRSLEELREERIKEMNRDIK